LQFDAPVDPAAFVHRIGRTARAGQCGRSLVLLLPHEDSYVPFLQQRGIALEGLPELEGLNGLPAGEAEAGDAAALERVKRLMETDRATMLKGSRAFVSFLRAYQEHQLAYVFPFKRMDLGALATGFCLLRIPRMKEILGRKIKGFQQSSIHPSSVPFRDKKQEAQRQERLREKEEEANAKTAEEVWAEAKEKEKERKAKAKAKALSEKERTTPQRRKAKKRNAADEAALLAREECLAKKLRKGQISAAQFQTGVKKASKKIAAGERFDGANSSDEEDSDDSEDRPAKRRGGNPTLGASTRWLTGGRKKRRGKSKKH